MSSENEINEGVVQYVKPSKLGGKSIRRHQSRIAGAKRKIARALKKKRAAKLARDVKNEKLAAEAVAATLARTRLAAHEARDAERKDRRRARRMK